MLYSTSRTLYIIIKIKIIIIIILIIIIIIISVPVSILNEDELNKLRFVRKKTHC